MTQRHPQFKPRPALLPLRDGLFDLSLMTPERQEHVVNVVTRGYWVAPVEENAQTPFVGVSSDGTVEPDLFSLEDTGFSPAPVVAAANEVLSILDPAELEAVKQDIDSPTWRMWTNAFPTWTPHGLRLEDLTETKRAAVLAVLQSSLSEHGYALTRETMRLNGELGRVIDQYPDTLTEWMYWFSIFGTPSTTQPWGWQIHGHHVDINCLIIRKQLVLTPTFLATEFYPDESDELFHRERHDALALINSLTPDQLEKAIVYKKFEDAPEDQQGPNDGRHLGGAGQDNRVIPYEGISVSAFTAPQRGLFYELLDAWNRRLPSGPDAARLGEISDHEADTHFAWYGDHDADSPFYYRIQSPVIMIEYDNHPGVFLEVNEPEATHVHTIVRTPNGNDYGKDLLRQHRRTDSLDLPVEAANS